MASHIPDPPPPSRKALDLDHYFPFLLTALSNKLSSSASLQYKKRFGVGVVEWRVLAAAAARPQAKPNDVCQMVGIDKGAVAKAIRVLSARGFVVTTRDGADRRTKTIHLTEGGWALHEQILALALQRETALLVPLSVKERMQLVDMLRRLLERVPHLKT